MDWSLGVKFKTGYVFGNVVQVLGKAQGNLGGGLTLSLKGTQGSALTPYWHLGVSGKLGVRVSTPVFAAALAPSILPAVQFLLNIPLVSDAITALKTDIYIVPSVDWTGKYPNGQFGDNVLLLYAKTVEGTGTFGLEVKSMLEMSGASVGCYAGGSATLPMNLPIQVSKVRGYAGVFAESRLFEYKKEYGIEFIFNDSKQISTQYLPFEEQQGLNMTWYPISDSPLIWGVMNVPVNTDKQIEFSSGEEATVLENVTCVAEPFVFADTGGATVLFALHDPEKPWYAATDIGQVATVGNTDWNLIRVTNDLDAEFGPALVDVGASARLAVWTRVSGDVSQAESPDDINPHLEIVVSRQDALSGTWETPVAITANNTVDRQPRAVLSNGTQGVLWIQNESDASLGNITHGDRLLYAAWTGTDWGTAQTLWSGAKGIVEYDFLADSDGQGHVIFCVDEDGDPATTADREIYRVSTIDGVWQGAIRLTADEVEDARPILVAPNGIVVCVWKHGNMLLYTPLVSWNPKAVYIESNPTSEAPTLAGVTMPGGAVIAYTAQAENGIDIVASFYNSALDMWSLPRQLTDDENAESSISLAFDGDELILSYLKTQTLRENMDVEIEGSMYLIENVPQPGRTDLCVMRYALGNDLAITDDSLLLDPPNPVPGLQTMVEFILENQGEMPASNFDVKLYDGDPLVGGNVIDTVTINEPLTAGTSKAISILWNVPVTTEPHTLYAVVDPDLIIEDRDRSNNEMSILAGLPDLTVASASSDAISTTSISLKSRIENQGTFPAGAFDVVWHANSIDGEEIARTTVDGMQAGAFYDAVVEWDTKGVAFQEEFVSCAIVVDSEQAITELQESNNSYMQSVHVTFSNIIEGEMPIEGETPSEGEVSGEGEVPAEGEGETLVEGEGELIPEGEGEIMEGEGEIPSEGEGESIEGEGEVIPEGEGEIQNEGEGEGTTGGCCSSTNKTLSPKDLFNRTLGDWLVIGMTLMALTALTYFVKK